MVDRSCSRLQIPFFEILRRRAKRAKLKDGRPRRRERECLKRFSYHLVDIRCRRGAGADVRIEFYARPDLLKRRYILDDGCVNRWIIVRGGERADGPTSQIEWVGSGNDVRLQLK